MDEKIHEPNDGQHESSITRFVNYLHSYLEPYIRNNNTMKTPIITPQRDEEHVYELDGVPSENSCSECRVNQPRESEGPVMRTAEASAGSPTEHLNSTLVPESDDTLSTITQPPPYHIQDKPSTASLETRATSEVRLPSHFSWPQNSFVGSRTSGLATGRRPSEGRFPDPVTKYAIHIPGKKRFVALAATHVLFITYLTLDIIATAMSKSHIYRNYFGYYVLQVLELVLTVLLVIITLYLLGGIVFYRPSNMQYPSIKKATTKQKCIFLALMAFAFTPLILACILTGLHKSANSQTAEGKILTCKDLGYPTTVLLQSPSNSTKSKNHNSTSSAVLSMENDNLRMTLSPVYKGIHEDSDLYFENIPNSIANISIHFVTGTRTFVVARKERLASGDIIPVLTSGFYVEEPNLTFPSLPQPVHSEVLDWKYHIFSEHSDLALYMSTRDSTTPLIKVIPRTLDEDCTMLRMCSRANITSTELLVPVGVILKELAKVAAACGPAELFVKFGNWVGDMCATTRPKVLYYQIVQIVFD